MRQARATTTALPGAVILPSTSSIPLARAQHVDLRLGIGTRSPSRAVPRPMSGRGAA